MSEITLVADSGRPIGSPASRRLRASGRIPGVIYGHGIEPVPVAVDARALRAALTTGAGRNALLAVRVGGATHLAMARDIQRDPVRGTVAHVDFQVVRRDEVVAAEVPIALVGEAHAVTAGDGVIDQQMFLLTVQTTPGRIPEVLEVDLGPLQIGEVVRVADLVLPTAVRTEANPEDPVVVAQPPQAAERVEEAEAEAAERAEAQEQGAPAEVTGGAEG